MLPPPPLFFLLVSLNADQWRNFAPVRVFKPCLGFQNPICGLKPLFAIKLHPSTPFLFHLQIVTMPPKVRPRFYSLMRKEIVGCQGHANDLNQIYQKYSTMVDDDSTEISKTWSSERLKGMVGNDISMILLLRYPFSPHLSIVHKYIHAILRPYSS
jgi:hypothetical protein